MKEALKPDAITTPFTVIILPRTICIIWPRTFFHLQILLRKFAETILHCKFLPIHQSRYYLSDLAIHVFNDNIAVVMTQRFITNVLEFGIELPTNVN